MNKSITEIKESCDTKGISDESGNYTYTTEAEYKHFSHERYDVTDLL